MNSYYVVYISNGKAKDCYIEASSKEAIENEMFGKDESFTLIIAYVNLRHS